MNQSRDSCFRADDESIQVAEAKDLRLPASAKQGVELFFEVYEPLRRPVWMHKTNWILLAAVLPVLVGCSGSPVGISRLEGAPGKGVVQQAEPVTDTGRQAAVLSLHRKTALIDGCRYGFTLTNNLPFEINDLPLRFTARQEGGVALAAITRSFFSIAPTQQQFREIRFQIDCDRIDYVEVSDPGRCIMGELTRQSAQPGQCIERVDIPDSPFVRLVKGAG